MLMDLFKNLLGNRKVEEEEETTNSPSTGRSPDPWMPPSFDEFGQPIYPGYIPPWQMNPEPGRQAHQRSKAPAEEPEKQNALQRLRSLLGKKPSKPIQQRASTGQRPQNFGSPSYPTNSGPRPPYQRPVDMWGNPVPGPARQIPVRQAPNRMSQSQMNRYPQQRPSPYVKRRTPPNGPWF